MRLFFGLEADAATQRRIAAWRETAVHCDGRAVPPANFHITLAFLGELTHQQLDQLERMTNDGELSATAGGSLTLETTGYWAKPGIFWLGPRTWPDSLSGLSKKLQQFGTRLGAKRQRNAFQPHITLYRRCTLPPPAPTVQPKVQLDYRQFSLFESVSGRNQVHYRPIAAWDLS